MLKVSIVTICYNNSSDIRQTIESVVNQDYEMIEYIIVDGASTDGTQDIINEYRSKIAKFISEPDKGLYDAINKGLREASGDIIGLIHAGDRLFDNKIVGRIADRFSMADIDGIYGHSVFVNNYDIPVRINRSPAFSKKLIRRGWMPSHQSIYLRRNVIERTGPYRLDLHPSSDYEFFLRYFYFSDYKIELLDHFVLKFSMGGRSTRNYLSNLRAQKQHRQCWLVNGEKAPLLLIPFKLLRKPRQFILAYKSRHTNSYGYQYQTG